MSRIDLTAQIPGVRRPSPPADRRHGGVRMLALFLLAVGVAIVGLFLLLSQNSRDRKDCEANLKRIYRSLELYEVDRGSLPSLAYFPADPINDPDSLLVALESYGADSRSCVCPALHPVLRDMGLTYIWNSALNGRRIPREGKPVWLLVEMTAINEELPTPHLGHYNVLYSDGSVKRVRRPLRELQGL